jgi:hypothetical protein
MGDLVKLVLANLTGYFRTLVNLLASPRTAPQSLGLFDATKLSDALAFFGISLVLSVVVKISLMPRGMDLWIYASQDAIWKAILVASASVAVRVCWLGCRGRFGDYLVANCYFFGILSIALPLVFIVSGQVADRGVAAFVLLLAIILLIFAWCVGAWLGFALHNQASIVSAMLRLPVFMLLLFAFSTLSWFVRLGTINKAVADAGGNDYTAGLVANTNSLLMILTFGLVP